MVAKPYVSERRSLRIRDDPPGPETGRCLSNNREYKPKKFKQIFFTEIACNNTEHNFCDSNELKEI